MSQRETNRVEARGMGFNGSRGWFGVAVGALVLSGLFSLILVVGRLPGLSGWIEDPLFARRCLVVHVNLALVVWMYAFVAALFSMLPGSRDTRLWSILGGFGVLMVVWSGGLMGVRPILSNYIPALDHPLFFAGLLVFGVALCGVFLGGRMWRGLRSSPEEEGVQGPQVGAFEAKGRGIQVPQEVAIGLRAAGLAFVLAMLTFAGAYWTTPRNLDAASYYELLFWGGGHVLQAASVMGMVSVWLWVVRHLTKRPVFSVWGARILFAVLLLPLFLAPWWAFEGTTTSPYYPRFTTLMRYGIFPAVLVCLGFCVHGLVRAWRTGVLVRGANGPYLVGFVASAGLTCLGFVLGSMIRGSTTLIPAHYHASIGGVTVSFMTASYLLMGEFGWNWQEGWRKKLAGLQPALFGVGQSIFAVGFGSAGLGRKTYGHEQHVRTLSEYVGLAGMGLGGLIAVISGLCFLALVGVTWFRHHAAVRAAQNARTSHGKENKIKKEQQVQSV